MILKTARYFLLALMFLGGSQSAFADGGFYVGGSIGNAATDVDLSGLGNVDEDETSFKAIGGYNFDILVLDIAVEASYVNLDGPSATIGTTAIDTDLSLLTAFGLAGVELGPVGVFAKVGLARWDADLLTSDPILGNAAFSESGTDPAYGIGARFSLGSVELRAEYERFSFDDADADINLLSAGVVWTF